MSWRETLGVNLSTEILYTHNSQKSHNPYVFSNCEDIEDCAHEEEDESTSLILEVLIPICADLPITSDELLTELGKKERKGLLSGDISASEMEAFAKLIIQRQQMDQGIRPARFDQQAYCKSCGPVWLWFKGEVLGCPWCRNRADGKPIPRPGLVKCVDCTHFKPTDHANLGHCKKGQPEAPCGIWGADERSCDLYLPVKITQNETIK